MKRTVLVVLVAAVVVGGVVAVKRYAEAEAAAAVAAFKREEHDVALAAWAFERGALLRQQAEARFAAESLRQVIAVGQAALAQAGRQNANLRGRLDSAIAEVPDDSIGVTIRLGVAGLREEVRVCRNVLSLCEQRSNQLEAALTVSERIATRERELHDSTATLLRAADRELAKRARGLSPVKLGLVGVGAGAAGYGLSKDQGTIGLVGLVLLALGLIW